MAPHKKVIHTPEELRKYLEESAEEFNNIDISELDGHPITETELDECALIIDTDIDIDDFNRAAGLLTLSEMEKYLNEKIDKYMSKHKNERS